MGLAPQVDHDELVVAGDVLSDVWEARGVGLGAPRGQQLGQPGFGSVARVHERPVHRAEVAQLLLLVGDQGQLDDVQRVRADPQLAPAAVSFPECPGTGGV